MGWDHRLKDDTGTSRINTARRWRGWVEAPFCTIIPVPAAEEEKNIHPSRTEGRD